MKWFQHQSDASDDIKIKRLEYKFHSVGYAIYFKVLEKVAKEGEKHRLSLKKFPLDFLATAFGVEKKELEECLTFMNEIDLIKYKNAEINIPNMKKYTDNWSKRTTKQLPSGYKATTERIDKNRIDKNISNLEFKGQKARIYFGTYQVFSGGSWKPLDPKFIKEVIEK